MARKVLMLFGGLALASMLATAGTAPMIEDEFIARVPFEFAVAGEVFRSGEYSIAYDKNWRLLYLCRDGAQCEVIQVRTMSTLAKVPVPRLMFRKTGTGYILCLIECGNKRGYALPGFRTEGITKSGQEGEILHVTAENS